MNALTVDDCMVDATVLRSAFAMLQKGEHQSFPLCDSHLRMLHRTANSI